MERGRVGAGSSRMASVLVRSSAAVPRAFPPALLAFFWVPARGDSSCTSPPFLSMGSVPCFVLVHGLLAEGWVSWPGSHWYILARWGHLATCRSALRWLMLILILMLSFMAGGEDWTFFGGENIPSYPFAIGSGPLFGSCCIKRQCFIAFLQQTWMLASWETNLIRKYAETNLNFTMCVRPWEDIRECKDLIEIKRALGLEAYACVRIYVSPANILCVVLAFFLILWCTDFNSPAVTHFLADITDDYAFSGLNVESCVFGLLPWKTRMRSAVPSPAEEPLGCGVTV